MIQNDSGKLQIFKEKQLKRHLLQSRLYSKIQTLPFLAEFRVLTCLKCAFSFFFDTYFLWAFLGFVLVYAYSSYSFYISRVSFFKLASTFLSTFLQAFSNDPAWRFIKVYYYFYRVLIVKIIYFSLSRSFRMQILIQSSSTLRVLFRKHKELLSSSLCLKGPIQVLVQNNRRIGDLKFFLLFLQQIKMAFIIYQSLTKLLQLRIFLISLLQSSSVPHLLAAFSRATSIQMNTFYPNLGYLFSRKHKSVESSQYFYLLIQFLMPIVLMQAVGIFAMLFGGGGHEIVQYLGTMIFYSHLSFFSQNLGSSCAQPILSNSALVSTMTNFFRQFFPLLPIMSKNRISRQRIKILELY